MSDGRRSQGKRLQSKKDILSYERQLQARKNERRQQRQASRNNPASNSEQMFIQPLSVFFPTGLPLVSQLELPSVQLLADVYFKSISTPLSDIPKPIQHANSEPQRELWAIAEVEEN